ncbi:MAG: Fic family protein [Tagaea sp.]|nr:Fic family protein [Tagaea sp.]
MIRYRKPEQWLRYDKMALLDALVAAKSAVRALVSLPFQKSWAEKMQAIQLKIEVAGTSRIEGAVFTAKELDAALAQETAHAALSRSQRQARSAKAAYQWIAALPADRPIGADLVKDVHRRIVTDCDDDHCPPGELRGAGNNVTFGMPQHRGAEGGKECAQAFEELCRAAATEFRGHDELIAALAFHYHMGAMHPFHDGNGRTARAVEALFLQRAGLKDTLFIAMSNYYHDRKTDYLDTLAKTGATGHDLTAFLLFGLQGIERQCTALGEAIQLNLRKTMFRDQMTELFGRLESTRKRVMARRQVEILKQLLEEDAIEYADLKKRVQRHYNVKNPLAMYMRDLDHLIDSLGAVGFKNYGPERLDLFARLDWATEITETEFFKRVKQLPKAKSFPGFKK